jgi:TonB family protein
MANEKQFRRTSAGDAEVVSAKAGLSVPERKVLAKLTTSQDAATLAQSAALTFPGVSAALDRLEKLGLVESTGGAKVARDGLSASARYSPTSGAGLKIIVGALVAAGIGFGGWKAMSPSKKTPSVAATTTPEPTSVAPAITAPSNVPPPAAPPQSAPAAVTPAPAKSAESTPTKTEKQLKDADAAAKKAAALKAPEPVPPKATPAALAAIPIPSPAPAPIVTPPAAVASPTPTAAPTAAPAPAPTAAPTPAPTAAPAPAPTAAPTPAPTAAPARAAAPVGPPKLLTREEPVFPRAAIARGVSEGTVLAKLFIDAAGNVTKVDIVRAQPPRTFDNEVIRALSRWKYERSGQDSTAQVELSFKAE